MRGSIHTHDNSLLVRKLGDPALEGQGAAGAPCCRHSPGVVAQQLGRPISDTRFRDATAVAQAAAAGWPADNVQARLGGGWLLGRCGQAGSLMAGLRALHLPPSTPSPTQLPKPFETSPYAVAPCFCTNACSTRIWKRSGCLTPPSWRRCRPPPRWHCSPATTAGWLAQVRGVHPHFGGTVLMSRHQVAKLCW